MPIIADIIKKIIACLFSVEAKYFAIASNLHITSRHVNIVPTIFQLENDE